ncbi:MAG: hypothetical protein KBD51_02840 [Candidatus Levybacteria bacterium]|nr:hypothetical protein [Candidatus Levybacteria bacterium]
MNLIALLLLISIFLESTIITVPLTLLIIIFTAVIFKNNDVFYLAFLSGLLLDILTLGTIGLTSAFFVLFVMLIFLYQKKFEIESLSFITISSFSGSVIYLFLTSSSNLIPQAMLATFIMFMSFFIFKKTIKKAPKYV